MYCGSVEIQRVLDARMRMRILIVFIALSAICTLLILETQLLSLQILAGLFLFCLAPGFLLIEIFLPTVEPIERMVLSIGSSFALSILSVYAIQFLSGDLTSTRVVLSLDLIIVILVLLKAITPSEASHRPVMLERMPRRVWLYIALVIALASLFRFPTLGYSEFQDDEIDVTTAARRVILGETEALFTDRRGPTQTLITAAFFLFTGWFHEWVPRLPVALANLMAVVTVFLLAWRMFNPRVGFLAGLLLAIEGFVLAYSRVVQMQSTLIFMITLSVLCFYRFLQTEDRTLSVRYQVLGSLFFALGLLSHYEMVVITPVLAFLYFQKHGWGFWRENARGLLISITVFLLISGVFYLPFVLHPQFQATFGYYSREIMGRGVINNLRQFLLVGTFYNSTYYLSVMLILLVLAWVRNLRMVLGPTPLSVVLSTSIGASALALILLPVLTSWTNPWPGLILFSLLAVFLVGTRKLCVEYRVLFLWLFLFFITYSFLVQVPRVHYYVYFLPWAILAAATLDEMYAAGAIRLSGLGSRRAQAFRATCLLFFIIFWWLCGYYVWLVFVRPSPEYALTYPQYKHPLYFTLYDQRYGEAFGFPHKSGWKTIGYLYQTGVLRGSYETNELYQKAEWYTRRLLRGSDPPRYYFVAEIPHRLQSAPWPRPFEPAEYHIIGTVMVRGLPRLQLYEHNAFSARTDIIVYENEDYEARYDALRSLRDERFAKRFQADDRFFLDAARYLETMEQEGDSLILEAPEQVGILSYYYQGDLPYYPLSGQAAFNQQQTSEALEGIVAKYRRLYALFWAVEDKDPGRWIETWLNDHLFKADDRWFGNLRLVIYAVPWTPLSETIENHTEAYLGGRITFLGYNLASENLKAGDTLQLTLFWQATSKVDRRYKVFVHLLDQDGRIIGQQDSEPGGGLRPTDRWPVGEILRDNYGLFIAPETPPGWYSVEVGMYDLETMQRLAVFGQDSQHLTDGKVFLGKVEVAEGR